MSHLINDRTNLVTEAIDGLLRTPASGVALGRLDGFPEIKVVHRTDHDPGKVALVSGGGSGHEPAHAGFVGPGMLTAAVCGEVFASPSVEAVLAGILAVTTEDGAGCLLIVKNYTGDRLNFGLAAERARTMGRRVEMVVVGDDIALPDIAQPRGIAGTLFVHKIAGALAESGASLEEVARTAREVAEAARSMGVALSVGHVPGSPREDRVGDNQAELGLGIHGEPGVEMVANDGAGALVRTMLGRLLDGLADGRHVAMLNDLGALMPLEASVVAREVLEQSGERVSHVVGPARLMTSLDMRGVSVSLLPARNEWVEALSRPVPMPAWPGVAEPVEPPLTPLPGGLAAPRFEASENGNVRALIERSLDAANAMEADLNQLDAKAGDGDTGSTVAGAARTLRADLDRLPLADTSELFRALGDRLSRAMGGSSGVLLAILFTAAAGAADEGADVATALRTGLDRVMAYGGAQPGDRTMIDALQPALEALPRGLDRAAKAAREGADGTANMKSARSGRAAYLQGTDLTGTPDPGAEAVARLFEAMMRA